MAINIANVNNFRDVVAAAFKGLETKIAESK